MILEKNLNRLLDRLPVFYTKLHPLRLHTGKYISGEPFDYLVIMNGSVYCFDAKETKDGNLYFKDIPTHQINDLLRAEKNGALVFFLIYFVKEHKISFVHPRTIMEANKATPLSLQVENPLKKIILQHFT